MKFNPPAKEPLLKYYWPYLVFFGFWLMVVLPWLSGDGFLFLLDFVPAPSFPRPPLPWQTPYLSGLIYRWLTWLISRLAPLPLVQTFLFSLPLLISGVSMYHLNLLGILTRFKFRSIQTLKFAALISGLFYAYNPFVTTRVFMGHFFLLYGYALIPWALLAWLKLQHNPSPRRQLLAGLAIAATFLFSSHHFILTPLLLLLFLKPRAFFSHFPLYLIIFTLIIILTALIIFWSSTIPANQLHPLGPWARAILAPFSGSYVFDALNLSATWKIDLPFLFPWESRPFFGLLATLLLLIMTVGFYGIKRHSSASWLAGRLALVTIVGLILAIGVAHPFTSPLAAWLYRHVPFWLGLRDSAKFISLIALSESILLAAGIIYLPSLFSRVPSLPPTFLRLASRFTLPLSFLLIFYLTSTALWGYNNQIYPLSYPTAWQETRSYLASNHHEKPTILFLPWHQYLPFSFTNFRTIANPAPRYFTTAHIISGTNNEVGGSFGRPFIAAENQDTSHQYIQNLLASNRNSSDFGARLLPLCVQYVMLATDTLDADEYDFLHQQNDLQLIFSRPGLLLWRNLTFTPSCY